MTLTFIQYLLSEAIKSHVFARPERINDYSGGFGDDFQRPFFQTQFKRQAFPSDSQHGGVLQKYTDAEEKHFENINVFLRHRDNPDHPESNHFRNHKDSYEDVVGQMDNVFTHHAKTSDKPMTVFRGIRGGYGFKPESHVDNGFLSTTVKSDIALLHAGRSRGEDPSVVLRIKIPAGTPHIVNPTGTLRHENEIIFPRGSHLNIHPKPHVVSHVTVNPWLSRADRVLPLHVHDVILTHPKTG